MGLPRPVLRNNNFPCSPGSQSQATGVGTYQQPCARFFPVGWGSLAPSYGATIIPVARDRSPRLQGVRHTSNHARGLFSVGWGSLAPSYVTATSPAARDRSPRLQGWDIATTMRAGSSPNRKGLPRPVLRNYNLPCSPGSQSQATGVGTYQQPCVGWTYQQPCALVAAVFHVCGMSPQLSVSKQLRLYARNYRRRLLKPTTQKLL